MTRFPLLLAATVIALMAAAASAETEMRDGTVHLMPEDESNVLPEVASMQRRAIRLGLFKWPRPRQTVNIDPVSRPKTIADCAGHDPAYIPRTLHLTNEDPRSRAIRIGQSYTYEFMAYRNAIVAKDCSCGSLRADWGNAINAFKEMSSGIENRHVLTRTPRLFQTAIKSDFDRMCDVRMQLNLE